MVCENNHGRSQKDFACKFLDGSDVVFWKGNFLSRFRIKFFLDAIDEQFAEYIKRRENDFVGSSHGIEDPNDPNSNLNPNPMVRLF